VAQEGELHLWDAAAARELWHVRAPSRLHDVAFSPDGTLLATAAGELHGTGADVILWDARSGTEVGRLAGHSGLVYAVAFAPSGRRLASASEDTTVRLWDLELGEEALVLRGHESSVWAVAFSSDGGLLASGGGNTSGTGVGVRIWDGRIR